MDKAVQVFEKIAKKKDSAVTRGIKGIGLGAAAGLVASSITLPLETIQANQATKGTPYHGKGFYETAKGLYKGKELYKGIGAKLLKVAPTVGITFGAYEVLKNLTK